MDLFFILTLLREPENAAKRKGWVYAFRWTVDNTTHQCSGSSDPLLSWIGHIDIYLAEFLRLEGRGDARN